MNGLKRLAPPVVRRAVGGVRAALARADVLRELRRLARGSRPIIAGPWLGEVGFEILYWIPFLRWAESAVGLDSARIVALSRGGPSAWYADVAGRYADAFDVITIDEFRAGNTARQQESGEQKQLRPTAFDAEVLARTRAALDLAGDNVLHPSWMYRLMQPYWWKHKTIAWVDRHASFLPIQTAGLSDPLALAQQSYIAVKFYFNDCFPATPETRTFVSQTLRALSEIAPVVSLSTGLDLDDHEGTSSDAGASARTIDPFVGARDNLAVQTAVVARARAFVGTYGGFSYLAPFCGVPALGVYDDEQGFDRLHLDVARRAFQNIGSPGVTVSHRSDLTADVIRTFASRSVRG